MMKPIIKDSRKFRDWQHKSFFRKTIGSKRINESGDFTNSLPTPESQLKSAYDDYGCFLYDTPILMEDLSYKRISEIKNGQYVITDKGRPKKVITTFKKEYNDYLYNINIFGIYKNTICTKEHPFLTDSGWKKAEELNTNDYIKIPLTDKYIKDSYIYEVEKDRDFLWLLGMYLAEGSLGKEHTREIKEPNRATNGTGKSSGKITFSLNLKETYIADRLNNITERLFGFSLTSYSREKEKRNSLEVIGYDVFLRNLLEELGGIGCSEKEINKRLMLIEPKLQLQIFKGWFKGDGHLGKRKATGVTTSKKLAWQMYHILLRNNIKCSIIKRKSIIGKKDVYHIEISGNELKTLFNIEAGSDKEYFKKRYGYIENGYLLRKVKTITSYKKKTNVYNLEVEDDNTYIVNSMAVHNCVTHSSQNQEETLLYYMMTVLKQEGIKETLFALDMIDENGKPNFSDWFTVIMSGTIPWRGNSQRKVWECMRKVGLISYKEFTFTNSTTQSEYNNAQITEKMIAKAKRFLEHFDINWEWVKRSVWSKYSNLEDLKEAIKESPLQVIVGNGTHAEMAYKIEGEIVYTFNSYKGTYYKTHHYKDCWYPIKCDITLKKKLLMPELYRKAGTKAIYFLNPEDMKLVPYADGIVSGATMFKTTGLVYSMANRVEELPYEIADYSMTTIKNSQLTK